MPRSADAWFPGLRPSPPLLSTARGLQEGHLQPDQLTTPPSQLQCIPTQLLLSAALCQFLALPPRTPRWRGGGLPGPQPLASKLLRLATSPPFPPSSSGDVLQSPGSRWPESPFKGKRMQPGGQVPQQIE